MRPWIAALVAFVFLGPYLAGSWEIAQEIDANATGPLRLGVAAVASLSLPVDQGAWVQLDDAVCNRDRAVRIGGSREEPWAPITGASGEGLVIAYDPPPEPGPMTGLLYRAKVHELRDLEAAGFFGPAGPPRGPLYVLFARFGPDHLVLRQRLGLVFVCGPFLIWALLWGIARAMKPRPPVEATDVRWGTPVLLVWGAMVLIIQPVDGPAPLAIRIVAAANLAFGLALLLLADTRPVLAVVNWLDGARARRA